MIDAVASLRTVYAAAKQYVTNFLLVRGIKVLLTQKISDIPL